MAVAAGESRNLMVDVVDGGNIYVNDIEGERVIWSFLGEEGEIETESRMVWRCYSICSMRIVRAALSSTDRRLLTQISLF